MRDCVLTRRRFAGSDTTAAAISSILYHLMKNPEAYHKLRDEIDEATRSGQLSSPHVRYSEAMQLPCLVACCKEGMRVHPSVGLTLPRHVPQGGCSISGHWFPEGTRVGVNAAVVHLDKGIFGHDADLFNPDRWFRDDAVNMDRYMFQVSNCHLLFVMNSNKVDTVRWRVKDMHWKKRELFSSSV